MKVEPEAASLVAVSGDGVRFPGGWTWGCQGSGIQGQWRETDPSISIVRSWGPPCGSGLGSTLNMVGGREQ